MKIGYLFAMVEEAESMAEAWHYQGPVEMKKLIPLENGDSMIVSGIGRTNAVCALLKLIQDGCKAIVNIGTCGSTYPEKPGQMVIPELFYDGDFQLVSDNYRMHDAANLNPVEPAGDVRRIFTVSHFCTEPLDSKPYLVDMESYDIVAVCRSLNIPVLPVKIVSDNADENAEVTFEEMVIRVIRQNSRNILDTIANWRDKLGE